MWLCWITTWSLLKRSGPIIQLSLDKSQRNENMLWAVVVWGTIPSLSGSKTCHLFMLSFCTTNEVVRSSYHHSSFVCSNQSWWSTVVENLFQKVWFSFWLILVKSGILDETAYIRTEVKWVQSMKPLPSTQGQCHLALHWICLLLGQS